MNLERFCLAGKHKTGFYNEENAEYRQVFISPAPNHKESGSLPASLGLLTFQAEAVRTQQITALLLYMEVRHTCASHSVMDELGCTMGQTYAGQSLWDTTVWIPKRTDTLFTQEQAIFAYIHQLGFFIHNNFLCLHCKDILRLIKSMYTVGINFLKDIFPNLNRRVLPSTTKISKYRPETIAELLLQTSYDWINMVISSSTLVDLC